jgi:hypothetical protein
MKKKTAYRTRNWREYNRALTQRGSLTVSRQQRRPRHLDDP